MAASIPANPLRFASKVSLAASRDSTSTDVEPLPSVWAYAIDPIDPTGCVLIPKFLPSGPVDNVISFLATHL